MRAGSLQMNLQGAGITPANEFSLPESGDAPFSAAIPSIETARP